MLHCQRYIVKQQVFLNLFENLIIEKLKNALIIDRKAFFVLHSVNGKTTSNKQVAKKKKKKYNATNNEPMAKGH